MAGHTAIRTENIYTHSNIDALRSVTTIGDVVLNINKSEKQNIDETKASQSNMNETE